MISVKYRALFRKIYDLRSPAVERALLCTFFVHVPLQSQCPQRVKRCEFASFRQIFFFERALTFGFFHRPVLQWRSLLALADLFVINRPHTPVSTFSIQTSLIARAPFAMGAHDISLLVQEMRCEARVTGGVHVAVSSSHSTEPLHPLAVARTTGRELARSTTAWNDVLELMAPPESVLHVTVWSEAAGSQSVLVASRDVRLDELDFNAGFADQRISLQRLRRQGVAAPRSQ